MILEARFKLIDASNHCLHRLYYINGKLMVDLEEDNQVDPCTLPAGLPTIEECMDYTKHLGENCWTILKQGEIC